MSHRIYVFPISLSTHIYHPTGDFFVNNFDAKLEILFNVDDNFKNLVASNNVYINLYINQLRIIKYYKEDNKYRCKFTSVLEYSNLFKKLI